MHLLAFVGSVVVVVLLLVFSSRAHRARSQAAPSHRRLSLARLAYGLLGSNVGAALPGATTSLVETAAGISSSLDMICVLSCSELGLDLSSGGNLKLYQRPSDISADFGRGEGLEFSALYIPATRKSILYGKLASSVAAAVTNVDVTGITGTSQVTVTGTPFDDVDLAFLFPAGFTVGVAGGMISYSLDGGRTYSGNFRIGTAVSFAVPNTGMTINFSPGTINTNDTGSAKGTSPKWAAQAITDAFTALKNYDAIPRLVLILGDISDQAHLQAVTNAILDYETSVNRFSRVICSVRDYMPRAVYQGSHVHTAMLTGQTVSALVTANTYTRSAGSWISDGFQVGDAVTVTGFTNGSNNGVKHITTLTATVMTVTETLATEATVASTNFVGQATITTALHTWTRSNGSYITDGFQVGQTVNFGGFANPSNNGNHVITGVTATVLTTADSLIVETAVASTTAIGVETDSTWRSAIEVIPGASPSSMIVSHKTLLAGGRARAQSGIDGFFKRRPAAWPIAIRCMSKDVKTSPARVEDGGLGWTITDAAGRHEDHDERVDGGLLQMRIACLRTFAEIGIDGVFVALGVTLDNDGAPMSRIHNGFVADLAGNIVQSETTKKLVSNIELKDDGTARPEELEHLNETILATLKTNLLSPDLGGNDRGPRVSNVTFSLLPGVDLSVIGARQPTTTNLVFLGTFEQFSNNVVVSKPA